MWMERALIENGFAFIAFLGVLIAFVRQIVMLLDRRLGQMVDRIDRMITQHHADSSSFIQLLAEHNAECASRCAGLSRQLAEHSVIAAVVNQKLVDLHVISKED